MKEKMANIVSLQMEKSALAQHGCSTGLAISFGVTRIVANISCYDVRMARESLEIHLQTEAINKEDGVKLSNTNCWLPVLEIWTRDKCTSC